MKAIIAIMITIIGILVFLIIDTDVTDIEISSEEFTVTSNSITGSSVSKETLVSENTEKIILSEDSSNKINYISDSGNNPEYNYDKSSSYGQNTQSYEDTGSSYGNTNSSFEQVGSTTNNATAISQPNNNDLDNSEITEEGNKTKDSDTSEKEYDKYQRLYDNGIMWYGETGILNIEYQSSHAETLGIGFMLHFDSSSINPINITYEPIDAIARPTPNDVMNDNSNNDNDPETDAILVFAWASLYGQWPQTTELTLASIEFQKVDGGPNNYTVNYTPTSTPPGFQLIK